MPRRRRQALVVCLMVMTLPLVALVGCTAAGDNKAPAPVPTVPGTVTLTPSHGSILGGNVVMVDIAGLPDDVAAMPVQARFGSAAPAPCEYDQVVSQFACRAPAHPDAVPVDVVVNANGNDVTPSVAYTYTTVGYTDMPVLTLDLATLQRNALAIVGEYPTGVRLGVVLKNGDPVGAMGKAITDIATVDYFFVPKLSDGIALREAGVTTPVAIMYLTDPADIPLLLRYNLEAAATSTLWVEQAAQVLERTRGQLQVHLWIDTGLGREGVLPEEALALAQAIEASPSLRLKGIATHLCCVAKTDLQALQRNDRANKTVLQKTRFDDAVARIRAAGIGQEALLHVGASDVLTHDLQPLYYDMLRVGGMFFVSGATNGSLYSWKTTLGPIKTLPRGWCIDYACTTTTTKDTRVGLLSQIPWRDDPIAFVVRGKTAPVLLDHSSIVTLDLSAIPDAVEGDEVSITFNPANDELLDATLPLPVTLKRA